MHTHYSEDSTTTLDQLIRYAEKSGLSGVAVTDHNTVEGAVKLAKKSRLTVIPGLEIETNYGHILALNVLKVIPSNLSPTDTVQRIHDAGGIAIAAHPAAVLKTGLGRRITSGFNLDAIEVINSGTFPFFLNAHLGREIAERLGLPQTAGSDAHHPSEIGSAYTLVNSDSNVEDIVDAIKKGAVIPVGKPISWKKRIGRGAFYLTKICGRFYSSKFSI